MFGLSKKNQKVPNQEEINVIIDCLEKIISHTDTRDDWEHLFSIKFTDKRAETIRLLLHQVSDVFCEEGAVYSPEGWGVVNAILEALKKEQHKKR